MNDLAKAFLRTGRMGFWAQVGIGAISVAMAVSAFVLDRRTGVGTRGSVAVIKYLTVTSLLVLAFTICQVGQRSVISVFWAIPPLLLGGTAAAAGIALINAIGNLGGFFGPTMMGWLRDVTGGYTGGLLVLAGALVLEAVLVASLRLPKQRETRAAR